MRTRQKRRGDNFPLFQRGDGRWAKKIRGRQVYFGTDRAEAEKRYYRQIGKLMDGQEPDPDDPTLRYIFNLYLTAQEAKVETGEIAPRTLSDSVSTLKQAVAILGDRLISSLQPEDFAMLKARWSKGRGIVTVAGDIRRLRAAFNWAVRDRKLSTLPQYGADFRQAPARSFELARSQRAALLFDPAELRKLLDAADPLLRAMIYLGANCAFLPVDIARLEFEEISHDFQWVRQARRKTGTDRRAALWPETGAALREAIKLRPKPALTEYKDLAFLTETGRPVVRATNVRKPDDSMAHNVNRVSKDFRALQQQCGVHRIGRGFNALRHGFLTIAESGGDFVAVAKVMGHKVPGVSSHYREHISDDRIKAVCSIVRAWLLQKKRKPR